MQPSTIIIRTILFPALMAGLAACDVGGFGSADPPLTAPDLAAPEPDVAEPSVQSRADARYYARIEASYLSQGRLRVDGGGPDTPFTARDLAENFLRITFYDEFTEKNGRLVTKATENRLHRWQGPVRLNIEFGASVPAEQRRADRAEITAYVSRLSKLTGLPIRVTGWRPNHTVLILNTDERRESGPRLRAVAPGISKAAVNSVTDMAPEIYCTAFGFTPDDSTVYVSALSVIRGELPPGLRRMCIHEELAQSLGLAADYPHARPSIFNDNEEFGALTAQDELMLKMLYDRRLTPGMTMQEARPIVHAMAAELMGSES